MNTETTATTRTSLIAVLAFALLATVGFTTGCHHRPKTTGEKVDDAIEAVGDAAEEAAEDIEDGAEKLEDNVKDATN